LLLVLLVELDEGARWREGREGGEVALAIAAVSVRKRRKKTIQQPLSS